MNEHPSPTPLPPDVRAWLDADVPAPERARLEETWALAEHGRPTAGAADPARKAAVWSVLETAAAETAQTPVRRTDRPARRPLRLVREHTVRWTAAAAVAALLVMTGLHLWSTQPVTVVAPYGETRTATLPDGSEVHLNSGTALSYERGFTSDARVVNLEGEAFFQVVRDGRPFVVETFNAETTVLGTSFNVRARRDEPSAATAVVVATGRVRLAPQGDEAGGLVLSPGQRSTLAVGTSTPTAPDSVLVDRSLAWRTGGLSFHAQPLAVIFNELERRYRVHITAPAPVLGHSATYHLHEPGGVEAVLADLAQGAGLRYRATAQGYEVYAP